MSKEIIFKFKQCEENDPENFYNSNRSLCKECVKARSRKRLVDKADEVRAYERARGKTKKRKAANKAYLKTDAGKDAAKKARKKYIESNKKARLAHIKVGNAVRDGKLSKHSCEECDSENTHAHHDDYAKPLDVRWLCPSCHKQWHKENGEGKNSK